MKKTGPGELGAKVGGTLRERAEVITRASPTDLASMPRQDVQRLIFELQVHQLELELQNEELHDTQAQLEDSRDRFADLYDFSPVGYLCLDNTGIIYEANLTVSSMLGVDREGLLRSKFSSFVAPEYQDASHIYWQEVLTLSHRHICELEMRRQDDTCFAVRLESIRRENPDAPSLQCRVALIDISDVKQAGGSLGPLNLSLQERVKSQVGEIELLAKAKVMASLDEGVMITANHMDWLDSEIVFSNEAMCSMVGYTLEDLLGQKPKKLLGDNPDSAWSQPLQEELLAGRIFSGERVYYRRDGSRCDIELVITPIYSPEQHCTYFVSVQRDISQRKRTEETLRNREERLQAILDTVPDAIITIDLNGIVQDCNPTVARLFGFSSGELQGKSVSVLMPAPYRDKHDNYLRRYQETGEAHIIGSSRQLTARHRDGHTFPITLSVSEIDHLGLYLGVIQDDTEVRDLQREVLRATRETQWRIGQALHDGPQQALAGLGLLARGLALHLGGEKSPHAVQAKKLSDKLQQANRNIRKLARGLVPVRVSSGSFMGALEHLARKTSEDNGLVCEFDCPDPIRLDDDFTADQLYHIAQEATINAIKHAQADHVSISLNWQEGAICLRVTDNGKGYDRAELESHGLGLHIMSYRAVAIGGEFAVSRRHGGGTVVSCNLTYVDDHLRE